jgi:uncharacterized protein YbcI
MLLALSNAIVRLYKDHYGKGPTRARAYYQGDVITCVLRDCFTRAEHTLIASGHDDAVIDGRHRLQTALRRKFVEAVEEITGRRVIGFMSGTQLDPDMSSEVFVLEPEPSDSAES